MRQASPSERLFLDHVHIARSTASRFIARVPSGVSADDVRAAAMHSLWWTVLRYGSLPVEEFRNMAWARVRGGVIDELRRSSWYSRRRGYSPVVLMDDADPFHSDHADAGPLPDEVAEEAEDRRSVMRAVSTLGERYRSIFDMYYVKGMRMDEMSKVLGVTGARVSQLHQQLISRLRRAVEDERGLRDERLVLSTGGEDRPA